MLAGCRLDAGSCLTLEKAWLALGLTAHDGRQAESAASRPQLLPEPQPRPWSRSRPRRRRPSYEQQAGSAGAKDGAVGATGAEELAHG
jgi:hypothetical protein